MTNSNDILSQNCHQLELEIKVSFLRAIGQSSLTDITKTVREREPNSLPLDKLYTFFGYTS